jgi:hypothetical protein
MPSVCVGGGGARHEIKNESQRLRVRTSCSSNDFTSFLTSFDMRLADSSADLISLKLLSNVSSMLRKRLSIVSGCGIDITLRGSRCVGAV